MNDPKPWVHVNGTRVTDPKGDTDYKYSPRKEFDDYLGGTWGPNTSYLRTQI